MLSSIKYAAMPLLTLDDIQKTVPLLNGHFGRSVASILMKGLSLDKVNDLYDRNLSEQGPEFASSVLDDLGVHYELLHPERLWDLPTGPFIVISNHPYGSIDGVMLVDIFGHIRPDFKIMVNGFLSRVEALDGNFIRVTPVGAKRESPSVESLTGVRLTIEHIRNGHPVGIFPSGAVSDLSLKERCIRDREWQEPVIRLIKKLRVPVLPVHFLDRNSDFYYTLGLIDWRVRLLRLPSEVFNKNGKRTRIAVGRLISVSEQDIVDDIKAFRALLRNSVYGLS